MRVPLFIRYPARIKPNTVVNPITAHIDLLPTLMEYCGIKDYKTKPLDGRSLVDLINGEPGRLAKPDSFHCLGWNELGWQQKGGSD